MDVKRIAETYSNLGQLTRGAPLHTGLPEEEFPKDLLPAVQSETEETQEQTAKTNNVATARETGLKAAYAGELTAVVSESIRVRAEFPSTFDLHDVSDLKFIPPRYV